MDFRLGGKRKAAALRVDTAASCLLSLPLCCPRYLRSLSCSLVSTCLYASFIKNWNITTTVHVDPRHHKLSYKLQELWLQTEADEAGGSLVHLISQP